MLKRKWKKELTISQLPSQIQQAEKYQNNDWWVDQILITDDGNYIGIWFDTPKESHLWMCFDGNWLECFMSPNQFVPGKHTY
jgi:hypothetical protein